MLISDIAYTQVCFSESLQNWDQMDKILNVEEAK